MEFYSAEMAYGLLAKTVKIIMWKWPLDLIVAIIIFYPQ